MRLNDYQVWSETTAIYPEETALAYLGLGLASEAGEVAGKIKKQIRDSYVDKQALADEIGDVFWYLVRLCDELEVSAEYVLERNVAKLNSRKERGVIGGSGDTR